MTRLPIDTNPLVKLADMTSNSTAVRTAFQHGVMNFIIEAMTDYVAVKMRESGMMSGMNAIDGVDMTMKLLEEIEDNFNAQYDRIIDEQNVNQE